MTSLLSRYSKFIAAIVGAVTEAINIGLVPHQAQNYVSIAVSILTALGVVGLTNGPSPQVVSLVNDVKAIKDQLEPLPKTGGLKAVVDWLAQQAEQHGKNIEAIAENAKADIEDLFAKKAQPIVTVGTPSSNQPQAGQDGTLHPAESAPAPSAEVVDHLAELATLVAQ